VYMLSVNCILSPLLSLSILVVFPVLDLNLRNLIYVLVRFLSMRLSILI
jgi:hypothetical protein